MAMLGYMAAAEEETGVSDVTNNQRARADIRTSQLQLKGQCRTMKGGQAPLMQPEQEICMTN